MIAATTIATLLFWPLCSLKTQFPPFRVCALSAVENKTHKQSGVGENRKAL